MNEATIHLLYFLKSSSLKVFDVKKKLKIPFIEKPISTRNLIIQILVRNPTVSFGKNELDKQGTL